MAARHPRLRSCSLLLLAALLLGRPRSGRGSNFVPARNISPANLRLQQQVAAAATLPLLLGAPSSALAMDVLPSSPVIQMRENPPFWTTWPPIVQVSIPFALVLVFAAIGPSLAGGEVIDEPTRRRREKKEREKQKLLRSFRGVEAVVNNPELSDAEKKTILDQGSQGQ
eukprot:TRINITY_DN28199_c0_g1_i1.p1 TRINITY_DN28199_c0_g1~~TRINITY_DN28199_c0_g1_i1.p1  ORF type:complete len:169 (+),score=28.59 TRINITY_DN28199_c0_g1_i1:56-562(+)